MPEPVPRISVSYNDTQFDMISPSPSQPDIELPPYQPPPSYPSSVAFPAHRGSDTKRPPSPQATEEGRARPAPAQQPQRKKKRALGCCTWLFLILLVLFCLMLFVALVYSVLHDPEEGGNKGSAGNEKNGTETTGARLMEGLGLGEAVDGMGGSE